METTTVKELVELIARLENYKETTDNKQYKINAEIQINQLRTEIQQLQGGN